MSNLPIVILKLNSYLFFFSIKIFRNANYCFPLAYVNEVLIIHFKNKQLNT